MAKRSMYVGMDVHKESIDISLAEEGRDGEVRHYGMIPGDMEAVAKAVRALGAPSRRLRFVYEAGPCGFGIYRYRSLTPAMLWITCVRWSGARWRRPEQLRLDRWHQGKD